MYTVGGWLNNKGIQSKDFKYRDRDTESGSSLDHGILTWVATWDGAVPFAGL